jgi:dCMP deaminase
MKEEKHCQKTVHSEINAICQAAKLGVSLNGAKIYVSMFPCFACSKAIIQCGIERVVAEYDYQTSAKSKELFTACSIQFQILHDKLSY